MKLDASDIADLRPVIAAAVRATLEEIRSDEQKLNGRLGFPEAEAASLLGLERHVLRDCRLRGEIAARKCGKKMVYSRETLIRFLSDGKRPR